MKRCFVQLAGSESPPVAAHLQPGVTAGQPVGELELVGFCLFACSDTPKFFSEKEPLYDQLTQGATLYAVVLPEVAGMYLRSLLI